MGFCEDPSKPLKTGYLWINAGLIRVAAPLYESKGRKFESCRAHHLTLIIQSFIKLGIFRFRENLAHFAYLLSFFSENYGIGGMFAEVIRDSIGKVDWGGSLLHYHSHLLWAPFTLSKSGEIATPLSFQLPYNAHRIN